MSEQREYPDRLTRGPYAGEESRSKSLQTFVRPSQKVQVEQLVRDEGKRSVSDWLYAIVTRELEAAQRQEA